ncbi:hypothetical protein HK097_001588 [Rhizophlyctis rosea]|uniref:Glycosyltransferase family 69 protein n=1 Tax=Rhizophlyctis rosea TaxID=64517 RepID=A0AAD5X187_9FUNG|nr:hypothetical protein HK097_001588 [Rhizophlyctis rosea]
MLLHLFRSSKSPTYDSLPTSNPIEPSNHVPHSPITKPSRKPFNNPTRTLHHLLRPRRILLATISFLLSTSVLLHLQHTTLPHPLTYPPNPFLPLVTNSTARPPLYIAANFYQNAPVLANFIHQVTRLGRLYSPDKIYVSIYENGSTDGTKFKLGRLKEELRREGIKHRVVTDPKDASFKGIQGKSKVPYLAELRNKLLEPLKDKELAETMKEGYIVFLNDIFFDAEDILQLLHTAHTTNSAAVCAMDHYFTFYDTFATRSMSLTRPAVHTFPYFWEDHHQQSMWEGKYNEVWSCWGGMNVAKAAPFIKHSLTFRALPPTHPFEASECCLIWSDLRRLLSGAPTPSHLLTNSSLYPPAKIAIDPRVRVSYEWRHYYFARWIQPLIEYWYWVFRKRFPETGPKDGEWEGLYMKSYEDDLKAAKAWLTEGRIDEWEFACVE